MQSYIQVIKKNDEYKLSLQSGLFNEKDVRICYQRGIGDGIGEAKVKVREHVTIITEK